ncbi:Molybdopterin-dependent oxidoreductase [Sulfidibacter corallicola]|uniref:Molybdopterin-dependent oxidoreductase n=1 Tax=Sulfidibacter corallicola TaxID=2818388 RepID=A0A8A4TLL8_SULCO|nr:molybdopterin cofactor-binding domain-containing protein [Sulfidibacter corallicola]QTD50856.1 molybdopterin-dependent oxidoreductase [Sulfidibacter corallicola]
MTEPRKFIIDTDVDIDDWMAMLFMLNHPGIEVAGITVVGTGAAHIRPGTRNALDLLMLVDKPDIPVAVGLDKPMAYDHAFPASIREPVDRLFGLTLPENPNEPLPCALDFLTEQLENDKDKVNILAIGPLTNLGTLFRQRPELAQRVERIYMMGGTVDAPGNVHDADPSIPNTTAEWNIYIDPVAAEIVFRSGAPITMVPLDASLHVPVTKDFYFRLLQNHDTDSATFVFQALTKDMDFLLSGAFYFWDPLAAALATEPAMGRPRQCRLKVVTENNDDSGQLLVDESGDPITVYFDAEAPAYYDLFLNTLNRKPSFKDSVTFMLNREQVTIQEPSPNLLLVDYLHQPEVGCTGTKLVCGEGGCGACTVMLTRWNADLGKLEKLAVNACLRPVCSLDGMVVTTTEGIGNVRRTLDEVQYAIAANNGSQCGYCTPGFVMNMFTLLQNRRGELTEKEIEDNFDGNICRCTGFRPILAGFKKFACDYKPPVPDAEICIDPNYEAPVAPFRPFDPPPEFVDYMKHPQPLQIAADGMQYFRPIDLDSVYEIKRKNAGSPAKLKLMVGNTSIGIFYRRPNYREKGLNQEIQIDLSAVPELGRTQVGAEEIVIGGAVTLSRVIALLKEVIATKPAERTRGLAAFLEHLQVVANLQVRNEASIAGNLFIAINFGFLSDVIVVLGALGARITVGSKMKGDAVYDVLALPRAESLPADSLITEIRVPLTKANEYVTSYKVRRRNEDCHAIVNAAFRVALNQHLQIDDIHLVYNGVAASYDPAVNAYGQPGFHPISADKTAASLRGEPWNQDTLQAALAAIGHEMQAYAPPDNAEGVPYRIDDTAWSYRKSLTQTLFFKFFVHVANRVCPDSVAAAVRGAGETYRRPVSQGHQIYNSYPDELPVSEPVVKLSAFMQASGEARYSHDMERPPHTLEAAFVYSLIARGIFRYVLPINTAHGNKGETVTVAQLTSFLRDWYPGFVDYVGYGDVPVKDANWIGMGADDPIFVPVEGDEVPRSVAADANANFHPAEITCIGAPLGLVVADTQETAREVAAYVRNQCIVFEATDKPLFDIEQALAADRLFPDDPPQAPSTNHIGEITRPGSSDDWLKDPGRPLVIDGKAYQVLHGIQENGFQNHFYLETMATLGVPNENKGVTLYTSTQTLADNQSAAANALGVSANDVRVVLRRDGGAFGGKQTRSSFNSTAVAVAANKLNRPVRLVLDRHTNFIMCGDRHPVHGRYHVAYDEEGHIGGLRIDMVSDGGNTYDVSFPVIDLAQLLGDNCYRIPTFRNTGQVAQTNNISNTAFRSFGTVQTINILEEAIEHVAHVLGKTPEEVREKNLYKTGRDRWTSFRITDQTLAIMAYYDFGKKVLNHLASLEGRCFEDRAAFRAAVDDPSGTFSSPEGDANFLLLCEFANTDYDFTPYLQGLKYCNIRQVWDHLKEPEQVEGAHRPGLAELREEVRAFNATNRWRKRGLSMIPLKYGVSYTGPRGTLNQGGAYIIAYADDGSVLVQHGGVESGQGIQTKMAQIAAEALDIPLTKIRMGDTDTNVIADASPTAASTGSDLNGGAVRAACLALRARLERFCEDLEEYSVYYLDYKGNAAEADKLDRRAVDLVTRNWRSHWPEVWDTVVSLAYTARINLAQSFRYKTPHYSVVDDAHPYGTPFFYFTYSAAIAVVEVDILTGQFDLLRTDILYDTGKSLNPLIDVGQVEGGFVQGVGYLTTEEMLYQRADEVPRGGFPEGAMTTVGTWDYKPPGSKTIPVDFWVQLVDNRGRQLHHRGPRLDAAAVKSSKGIGEPPLVLANTVFFALKQAVAAARADAGEASWFPLRAPASTARIQEAAGIAPDQLNLK